MGHAGSLRADCPCRASGLVEESFGDGQWPSVFFGATFVSLYSTETKGAWIGFIFAVVIFSLLAGLFLVGPRARRLTVILIGLAGVIAGLGFMVIRHYALQRKQSVDFRVLPGLAPGT